MVSKISLTTSKRSSISTVTIRAVMILLRTICKPSFGMLIDSSVCGHIQESSPDEADIGGRRGGRLFMCGIGRRCAAGGGHRTAAKHRGARLQQGGRQPVRQDDH